MTRFAGRHFTTAELDALRRGPALRAGVGAVVVEHLSGLCLACWPALRRLAPPTDEPATSSDPVVRALRTLTRASRPFLGARHRAAVADVEARQFAFAELALEEGWRLARRQPRDRTGTLRSCLPVLTAGDGGGRKPAARNLPIGCAMGRCVVPPRSPQGDDVLIDPVPWEQARKTA